MKKLLYLIVMLGNSVMLLQAQCVINPLNVSAYTIGTKSYGIVKETKTWSAAKVCAVQFSGRLAVIESQLEQDSIVTFLGRSGINNINTVAPDGGGASYVWLGGNDRSTEGVWVWDSYTPGSGQFWQGARTGSVVGGFYNNWGNEPDNFRNQDALGLALTAWPFGSAGEWNDVDENNLLYFIIEYPGTVGLEEMLPQFELTLSPNPAQEQLTINCSSCNLSNKEISIFSIEGKLLYKNLYQGSTIDIGYLDLGTYLLRIEGFEDALKFQKN